MKPIIDVYMDYVIIEGVRVNKPSRISVGQWQKFWDIVAKLAWDNR